MNAVAKAWIVRQFVWIGISFAINMALLAFLPFYIAFPLSFVVFIAVTRIIRRNYIKTGNSLGNQFGIFQNSGARPLEYSCMACGAKHVERECPRCGSKMKKVELHEE